MRRATNSGEDQAAIISFENVIWSPTIRNARNPLIFQSPSLSDIGEPQFHSTPLSLIEPSRSRIECPATTSNVAQLNLEEPSPIQRNNSQGFQLFNSSIFSRRSLWNCLPYRLQTFSSVVNNYISAPAPSQQPISQAICEEIEEPRCGVLINLTEIFQTTSSVINNENSPPEPPQPETSVRIVKKKIVMGSLFRSEPMVLVHLIFTKDAAYQCVGELGKLGMVQFNDLNASKNIFQRYFVRDTRKCDEVERKLRFIRQQIHECVPKIEITCDIPEIVELPSLADIKQLDVRLDELEKDFIIMNRNEMQIRKNLNEMIEYKYLLERIEQFFEINVEDQALRAIGAAEDDMDDDLPFSKSIGSGGLHDAVPMTPLTPLLGDNEKGDSAWFIVGTIPYIKVRTFERVLWRACRRTAFVRISDSRTTLNDPETLDPIDKVVFIVFFKGERLRQIINQVCDGFNARQYPCKKDSLARQKELFEVVTRIQDLSVVVESSQKNRFDILSKLSADLPSWLQKVQMQKAIYHTLNMCTVDTNGFLGAECWIPENEVDNVRESLHRGLQASGTDVAPVVNVLNSSLPPPTFHRTNKFTQVFQSIVDSYGIATYREVNPAPFTIITFPFLFAVMFGDAAHGLILFLAGLYLIWNEKSIMDKRLKNEIFQTFFGGRYIIILMGFFSIYTGFIYNDVFAKSVNIFGSRWLNSFNTTYLAQRKDGLLTLEHIISEDGPYLFGLDPIWNIAENKLLFLNSLKMKVSVILGVSQMLFGIVLSLLNHRFFNSWIDILTNFVPQILFLSCIFVYLCVQMIVKWIFFTVGPGVIFGQEYPGAVCAPSLLIGLINMFMFKRGEPGFVDSEGETYRACYLNQWYPYQSLVEICLISVAVACIPVMLFGKPIFAYCSSKRTRQSDCRKLLAAENGEEETQTAANDSHGDHSLSDVIVHQAIHTIEFVLGCVSHTASYLRLWALSLAHAQLSEVLWHMVFIPGFSLDSPVGAVLVFLVFGVFAVLTFVILVTMEGLSAFLHALRLHWVEFQSKFYQGLGHEFHPYSLTNALEEAERLCDYVDDSF